MFWFSNTTFGQSIKRVIRPFELINVGKRDFCRTPAMANSRFDYVKDFETKCVIMPNCWIVVRIEGRLPSESFQHTKTFNNGNDLNLMNYAAFKVMKSFRDIVLSYGHGAEYSFVFRKNADIYNRRAAKIASSVNSLFTAIYVSQWTTWFPNTPQITSPCFSSSTFVHPTEDCLKSYLSWRQIGIQQSSDVENTFSKISLDSESWTPELMRKNGTTFLRKNAQFPNSKKLHQQIVVFLPDFRNGDFWKKHLEVLANGKTPKIEMVESKMLSALKMIGQNANVDSLSDLEAYKFWKEYNDGSVDKDSDDRVAERPRGKPDIDDIGQHEFEVEDIVRLNDWIVVRIDGKGFTKFANKHEFEKPNDLNALNVMNFAAVKVMETFEDIVLSYGQSDEYTFVFHKSTKIFERRASEIESCVNSIFTANYIVHWKTWNPDRVLQSLPTFDSRTVPYPSDSVLKDYLSWRQADVHINNLFNTCFWGLVLKKGMKNSDAEEYLRLNGTYSADKRRLLVTDFDLEYEELPAMYRKGTILLRKNVSNVNGGRKLIVPYCTDMIGDGFWREHREILANGPLQDVKIDEEDLPDICRKQTDTSQGCERSKSGSRGDEVANIPSSEYPGIRGLLCKDEEFEMDPSIMPSCWIMLKIEGREFDKFSVQHGFQKPNDEAALNLMSHSALKIMQTHPDIVLSYGHSDNYLLIFHNTAKLYRQPTAQITSDISQLFAKLYATHWNQWFPQKTMLKSPTFHSTITSYPSIGDLRDSLNREQREAHEKNLHETVLWKLVMDGGRSLADAEAELQNATKSDKNELLFQEFGINYNNMPARHKKGTILVRKGVNIGYGVQEVMVPYFVDIFRDSFWKDNDDIVGREGLKVVDLDKCDIHSLLKVQIDAL